MTPKSKPEKITSINVEDFVPHNVFESEFTDFVHEDGDDELFLFI